MSVLSNSFIQYIIKFLKSKIEAKQDKLVSGTNIKTINGTSLLGSGNIAIEGGDSTGNVDEGRLVWSGNYAQRGTLLDNIMKISGNNVLAFMPPSAITIEYSTDNGVTWLDYGWNDNYKTTFVTPEFGFNGLFLGKSSSSLSSNNRLRITCDFIAANMRFTPSKSGIYFFGVNNSDSFHTKLLIEKYNNYGKDVWEELSNQKITSSGWGTFRLPTEDWGYKGGTYRARFRCEFYRTADSVNSTAIANMIIMATDIFTANTYAKNHRLYTFDQQQNATFPNAIKGKKLITDGGKSTQVVKGDGSLEEESALAVASAIDAEYAVEADYAGVADKATKLATARKIGITGGAVGTATNFDGSGNINIPVTTLYEDKLAWSTTNIINGTIVDNIMRQARMNILSFMPASAITAEYSNDGGATWIDYGMTDAEKVALVTPILPNYKYLYIGNTQTDFTIQNRTRVIIDLVNGNIRGQMRKLFLKFVLDNPSVYIDVYYEIYDNYNTGTWSILVSDVERRNGDKSIAIPYSMSYMGHKLSGNYPARLKIEIYRKDTGTDRVALTNIEMLASVVSKANAFVTNGSPMTVDWQQNATFPAAITAIKLATKNGTANQVVLGNGALKPISELSPITDADAEILLDNHIHSINAYANGNNVNISVIESSKNGNTWETEDNDIPIPLATTTSAGVMSKEDKVNLEDLTKDGYVYPTNYLANWNGNSTIEVDDNLQIELDNITSYNPNTEGLIFTVNIQTPSQHDGEDYIYLSLYDSDENELAYMEHLITDDDCHNGSLQLELKCPLAAITSGYIDLYNSTNEPINIANPILKRYKVRNIRDISDKLLEKIGDINTILESIINS